MRVARRLPVNTTTNFYSEDDTKPHLSRNLSSYRSTIRILSTRLREG